MRYMSYHTHTHTHTHWYYRQHEDEWNYCTSEDLNPTTSPNDLELISLHWILCQTEDLLRLTELTLSTASTDSTKMYDPRLRVVYKLSVMMYSCLHGQAPQYLLDVCQPVSDVASHRHLRSAGRRLLNVPHQRRSTFARRAFSVAGPSV